MCEDHLKVLLKIIKTPDLLKRQLGHVPFQNKITQLIKFIFAKGINNIQLILHYINIAS
jgi:hypothetical protein